MKMFFISFTSSSFCILFWLYPISSLLQEYLMRPSPLQHVFLLLFHKLWVATVIPHRCVGGRRSSWPQNLQSFTGNGVVSMWAKSSRVGQKTTKNHCLGSWGMLIMFTNHRSSFEISIRNTRYLYFFLHELHKAITCLSRNQKHISKHFGICQREKSILPRQMLYVCHIISICSKGSLGLLKTW